MSNSKKTIAIFSTLFLLANSATLPATVLNVPSTEYPTIQSAIDTANTSDTVIVYPGTYQENISFWGNAITVRSSDPNDWDTIKSTIIDGNENGSCVSFTYNEGPDSILKGFTLTNGIGSESNFWESGCGGGILIENSSPTICNCYIFDNYAANQGGGIALLGDCHSVIDNCIIVKNQSPFKGGGILNSCQWSQTSTPLITNCTIADNNSSGGEADVYAKQYTSPVIQNSIIYDRLRIPDASMVKYSCVKEAYIGYNLDPYDLTVADGNINVDPRFSLDYHLDFDSPCLNAGDPGYIDVGTLDIDGQPRVIFGRVDMGADEIAPTIIVDRPSGGELWISGSNHFIRWQSYLYTNTIDIYYSDDSGQNWNLVEADVANTGSYLWLLPMVDSEHCLVKLFASVEPLGMQYLQQTDTFTIHPALPPAIPPIDSPWPTLHGNPQRTSLAKSPGIEIGFLQWQFNTDAPIFDSAVIGANDNIHLPCQNGTLYTLDTNGTQLWNFNPGSPLAASPSVGPDGTIYIGYENGSLYALSYDGHIRWRHDTQRYISTAPAVASDGKVFAASEDGNLYAFESDGSDLWTFSTSPPGIAGSPILASPALGPDDTVYLANQLNNTLFALDPNTANIKWTHDFPDSSIYTTPIVDPDGTIYLTLTDDPHLYALDPATGQISWKTSLADTGLQPVAHWKFDEFSGALAHDSSGNDYDADLINSPTFQPTGGQINGALELDGVDQYIDAPFILNPADGPFTACAWVKGGNPNEKIICQTDGTGIGRNWLNTESTGYLGTNVRIPSGSNLTSTYSGHLDGDWHHVAVVWDGARRHLYADGIEVAADPADLGAALESCDGRLYIGAHKGLAADLYWTGLFDDVHIEAVPPDTYSWAELAQGPDGTIYVSFADPFLRAVNPNGTIKWTTRLGQIGCFSLAVSSDGLIYATAEDSTLYVVNPDNGRELSRFNTNTDALGTPAPIVQWKFNAGAGQIAFDALGNKHGTLHNFPTDNSQWQPGQAGTALRFDGLDDYIQINNYHGITGNNSRKVSAWIKTTQTEGTIFAWGKPIKGEYWKLMNYNGTLRLNLNGNFVDGSTLINDGQWRHVSVEFLAEGMPYVEDIRLYVDGKMENLTINTDFGDKFKTATDGTVFIGARHDGSAMVSHFEGLIDNVRIYDLENFSLSHPVISRDGSIYISDSAHKLWALAQLPYPELPLRLHRPTDFNRDGICNLLDFALLANDWLGHSSWDGSPDGLYFPGDTNRDSYCNFRDILNLSENWLYED